MRDRAPTIDDEVRASSNYSCALCAPDRKLAAPEFEIHVAHVLAKKDHPEDKKDFWNLIPLCGTHNPSGRERGDRLQDFYAIVRAYDYWTFARSRSDLCVKLALYGFVELTISSESKDLHTIGRVIAHLDDAIWTCRSHSLPRFLDLLHQTKEWFKQVALTDYGHMDVTYLIPSYVTRIENILRELDQGIVTPTLEVIEMDRNIVADHAIQLFWRLLRYPQLSERLLDEIHDATFAHGIGARATFAKFKTYDRELREVVSRLERAVSMRDRKEITRAVDGFLNFVTGTQSNRIMWDEGAGTGRSNDNAFQLLLKIRELYDSLLSSMQYDDLIDHLRFDVLGARKHPIPEESEILCLILREGMRRFGDIR